MYEYQGDVLEVRDGDGLIVMVDLGLRVHTKADIRLAGINAPEKNTDAGQAAKAALERLAPVGARVRLRTFKVKAGDKKEKYGRWLGEVWLEPAEGDSLNQLMVDLGHARWYDGGKR